MSEPLVTVIVPVHNAMPYLGACIRSIAGQAYTNMEIIVTDDGSTDGSGGLCDELAATDARITVIHRSNGGVGVARNCALAVASGEWITFVDSDDILEPWCVSTLLSAACASGAEAAMGGYRTIQKDGEPGGLVAPIEDRTSVSARRALEMLMYQEGVDTAPWGKLFRTDMFEGVQFPSLPSSEDLATVYKPLLKSAKVAIVRDSGYRYRVIAGSLSSSRREEAAWHVAREVADDILERYPELYKACSCRRLSFALHVMPQAQSPDVACALWNEVVATRGCVLRDGRARKEARVAALLSYAGKDIAVAVLKHRNEAKGRGIDR
ncbi:glycosyltransferase [Collinsella tanakaei]|nr:glycosyltransferase [Collinsella tanakaei]